MKIPANVRSKLSQLLQNISFVESHRRSQDVIEWYHGKINKKEVLICIWNFQKNMASHCFRLTFMIILANQQ
ncbi:hypothetical protein EAMBIBNC_00011 [Citrobacter phage BSwM KMM4]|nr:hypothetical protein EAMBIBNC_00011 [Citrobacter phage BSwM KMM4]